MSKATSQHTLTEESSGRATLLSLPTLVQGSQSSSALTASLPSLSQPESPLPSAKIVLKRKREAVSHLSGIQHLVVEEGDVALRYYKGLSYYFDPARRMAYLEPGAREFLLEVAVGEDGEPTPAQLEWLLRATTHKELNLPFAPRPSSKQAQAHFNRRGDLLACAEEVDIRKVAASVVLASKLAVARNAVLTPPLENRESHDPRLFKTARLSGMSTPHSIVQRSKTLSAASTGADKEVIMKASAREIPDWGMSSEPCKCKKSHCLKKYCSCFSKAEHCSVKCTCRDCFNMSSNRTDDAWIAAVCLAHGPPTKAIVSAIAEVPVTRLLKGVSCRCKGNRCIKKYCECVVAKIKCSSQCQCMNCLN
jgi:hypothetical protein